MEELDGVVLFDLDGNRVWRDSFLDCYCACAQSRSHLLYLCYPDFPLKQLDVRTRQVKEWTIPAAVGGSSAISCLGSTVFFHSTYEDGTGIYRWKPGTSEAERIGEYPGPVRGLAGCRFLSVGEKGCTVVDLRDEVV